MALHPLLRRASSNEGPSSTLLLISIVVVRSGCLAARNMPLDSVDVNGEDIEATDSVMST